MSSYICPNPTSGVNSHVHYELWVVCQCRFITCEKRTTLVGDVDCGGGCACIGAGNSWYIPFNFFCEFKTALKNRFIYFFNLFYFYLFFKTTFEKYYPWSPLVMNTRLLGVFKITASVSLLVVDLFIVSISSWFSPGRLYISRNLCISSRISVL